MLWVYKYIYIYVVFKWYIYVYIYIYISNKVIMYHLPRSKGTRKKATGMATAPRYGPIRAEEYLRQCLTGAMHGDLTEEAKKSLEI